jgi:hypothetical protein
MIALLVLIGMNEDIRRGVMVLLRLWMVNSSELEMVFMGFS